MIHDFQHANDPLQSRYRFLIPDSWAGGVTIIAAQWARELAARAAQVQLVFQKDVSRGRFLEPDRQLFEGLPCTEIRFDSLDKATRIGRQVFSQLAIAPNDLMLVNSSDSYAAKFLRYARCQGKSFKYIQVMVNDNAANYANLKRSLSTCDLIVSISQQLHQKSMQLVRDEENQIPTVQVPPGTVVGPRQEHSTMSDGLRICYVGRVEAIQKRVFDLVEMMAQICQTRRDVLLTIVGDGLARKPLDAAFRNRGLANHVSFVGRQSHARVLQILKDQHVFVLPSEYEGFGVVLCEAMAAGLVPIATRVAGPQDVIRDGNNGFLVDVGDVAKMAQRACELAVDESQRRRMSERAWETAQREMSVANSIDQLTAALNRVGKADFDDRRHGSARSRWLSLDAPLVPNLATRWARRLWRNRQSRIRFKAAQGGAASSR